MSRALRALRGWTLAAPAVARGADAHFTASSSRHVAEHVTRCSSSIRRGERGLYRGHCRGLCALASASNPAPATSATPAAAAAPAVPVLIVGGGPVGLTLSILLSRLGVDSLLVERHASPTTHPQAHFINNRTMEVFRPLAVGPGK
jgi:hypothetical protein